MAAYSSMLAWISHGQRSLAGYSPEGCKESDVTEANTHTHTHTHTHTDCHQVAAGCHSNSSKQGPSLIQDYLNLYPLLQMIL